MSVTLTPPTKRGRFNVARFCFENAVGLVDASLLQSTLKRLIKQGLHILVVNMRGAKDVDRAGWDCLVTTARQLHRKGGGVVLRHCPDDLYNQIHAHQWDRLFLVPDRRLADAEQLPAEIRDLDASDEPEGTLLAA